MGGLFTGEAWFQRRGTNMSSRFPSGRLYYSPHQVRIWIGTKFFDLGERSLSSCRIVADEFDFELIETGVSGRGLKPSRAASVSRSSSGGRLQASSDGRPVASSSTPGEASEAPTDAKS